LVTFSPFSIDFGPEAEPKTASSKATLEILSDAITMRVRRTACGWRSFLDRTDSSELRFLGSAAARNDP
jgi:hypothetical protein